MAAILFILFCVLTWADQASLGKALPADLSIGFHSTCIVPVNHSLTGIKTTSAEVSLLVNMTIVNSLKPHHLHGGCLTFLLDSQIGSHPHRLICASFGQVVTSNSCINYDKPPVKDLCHNVVQTLQFNETEDGFARLTVFLKNMESISGKKMRLSFKSIPLSNDPSCDFELTVTAKNYTTPGEPTTPTIKPTIINTTGNSSEIPRMSSTAVSAGAPTKVEFPTSGESSSIPLAIGLSIAGVLVVLFAVALFCWMYRAKTGCFKSMGNKMAGLDPNNKRSMQLSEL